MDWDRSCERVQYLAKTYALCNHFTACSPNFRLFRRMAKSAKTGLKSIYANEANISPKPMLCAAILRHVAQTADFFLERRKMDFNWSMRMSPIFSENVCFVQPFDGMWPKPPTFSHNAEKCTEIDKCECGQYLAKTYALCNHFTAFFAERRKMDWDRSCERVQYLAETYALCNHFTACGPNLRLFRRKAKNGLKLIYPNESCTLPKPMLCPTIWRHEAQPTDFFAECRKMDWNRSMRMRPIFSKNVCFVQPFYGMWPKPQTFSQKGEKWTEIDLSEWVLYFAKTDALSNHLTAWGSTYRLFRRMPKNGLNSINANETNI